MIQKLIKLNIINKLTKLLELEKYKKEHIKKLYNERIELDKIKKINLDIKALIKDKNKYTKEKNELQYLNYQKIIQLRKIRNLKKKRLSEKKIPFGHILWMKN